MGDLIEGVKVVKTKINILINPFAKLEKVCIFAADFERVIHRV